MNLEDVILRGLAAARPAATDVPIGTLYYSTDTATTDRSNGTAWQTYADTGSGINQLTGDVTAGPGSGSQAATIANNAVTDAKLRDSAALSVIGRSVNSSGDPADVAAGTDHQILRRSGTALAFGAIQLAQSAAVSGVLPTANGGTSVDIASAALPLGSGQVTFPATQNPSADSNTLDDYEEGTWTPTVGGISGQSGQAYSSQVGTYVKVGQLVMASFAVTLSTLGTITGQVQIQGLPFTSQNLSGARFVCPIFWVTTNTAFVLVQGVMLENVTAISLNGATAATTSMIAIALAQADLTNTTRFVGTIVYRASA